MYIDTSICDAFVWTLVVLFVVGGGNISSKVGHKNDIKAVALPIKSSAQREITVGRPATYIQILWHASFWITKCIEMNIEKPLNEMGRKLIVFTPWSFQIERLAAKFPAQNPTINLIASGRRCFYVIAYFEFLSTTLDDQSVNKQFWIDNVINLTDLRNTR